MNFIFQRMKIDSENALVKYSKDKGKVRMQNVEYTCCCLNSLLLKVKSYLADPGRGENIRKIIYISFH